LPCWPLGQRNASATEGSETVVYKDQLAEVQRDAAAGLIGANEADAARVEISRRLLAASEAEERTTAVRNLVPPRRGGDRAHGFAAAGCRALRDLRLALAG
jgi:cytochrome c-type biogenesis protein CcmI